MNNSRVKLNSECEVCGNMADKVFHQHHNIWMCENCVKIETEAIARDARAKALIEESRKVDSNITLKQDVFLAKTVPFVELKAAIDNNLDIPADQKDYALFTECANRRKKLQEVIFHKRAELTELETEERMWLVNAQNVAGRVRAEFRNKPEFAHLYIAYEPKPITKKQKTTAAKGAPSKKVGFTSKDKAELYEAAKKYGVPAPAVQNLKLSRKDKSYDDVAKEMATMMGLL